MEAWGDLNHVYENLKGGYKEEGARLFSVIPSARTRDSGHKMGRRRFCVTIRKHFCALQVTLVQISKRGCGISFLEISKSCLNVVLGTLLWVSLLEQGVGQMDPDVPSDLSYPVILWFCCCGETPPPLYFFIIKMVGTTILLSFTVLALEISFNFFCNF